MRHYKRNELYSELRNPQEQYFHLEEDFKKSILYYLIDDFSIPWYAYLFFVALFGAVAIFADWKIALIVFGILLILPIITSLSVASSYRRMAKVGTYVGFDEDGVGFWAPTGEADEDGNVLINMAVKSPWYELNEMKVFDSFIVLHFVSTSEMPVVFIPTDKIYDVEGTVENILAYWKNNAQDKPVDQKDRRLIALGIIIAIFLLRIFLKFLKARYFQ